MCNILLCGAIGDALGVPFEMMLPDNPLLVNWNNKTFLGSQNHDLKPGFYSDDTQMSRMLAESLLENNGFNPQNIADRYVDWIVSGRARGYGGTTFKAIQNLQAGIHWSQSGVSGSFGNGTAMRVAPIGVYFRDDLKLLKEAAKIDSAITHASPEADAGSLAIALAVSYAINNDLQDLAIKIADQLPESKVKNSILSLSAIMKLLPEQVFKILGTGPDVRQTVPSALYCFMKYDNYYDAIIAAIRAGGDTDTTASIVGALFGAKYGMTQLDQYHIKNVEDSDKLIELDQSLYNRSNNYFFPRGLNGI